MGIVLHQVALIALITQPPELAQVVAVIEEELREGLDAPKGVAGSRERSLVVAVEEDHWDLLDAADIGAKANHRLAEIEVPDHREVVGKFRADLDALAWRRAARQSSGAKLRQNRDDGRNAKMFGGHSPLPSGKYSPNAANSRHVPRNRFYRPIANGAAKAPSCRTHPSSANNFETLTSQNFLAFCEQLFQKLVT